MTHIIARSIRKERSSALPIPVNEYKIAKPLVDFSFPLRSGQLAGCGRILAPGDYPSVSHRDELWGLIAERPKRFLAESSGRVIFAIGAV
jgi:hypothetical protein